jgi:predicted nuclease with RNAse H fold
MLAGEKLYKQLQKQGYALFAGRPLGIGGVACETFPQAIACSLARETVSAKKKSTVRRRLLQAQGIATAELRNIDFVDAALCGLAASRLRAGAYRTYGDAKSGLIVVPRMQVA